MSRILMEKRTDSLSVELTEGQWISRVRERSAVEDDLDAKTMELERLKSEHALARSRLEAVIKDIQGRERTLAQAVRTRTEVGPVDVEAYADLADEKMVTIRLDTGEEIGRRPLTEVETRRARQRDLDFGVVEWGKTPAGAHFLATARAPVPEPEPEAKPQTLRQAVAKEVDKLATKGFDWSTPKGRRKKGEEILGEPGRRDALPEAADAKTKPKRGPKAGTKAAVETALDGARE